jgi:hypothetical protein
VTYDRSWESEWGRTWLADAAYTSTLDGWVRRRMVEHHAAVGRQADQLSVGPWTIDSLVNDIHRHATAARWLWATTAICFVQELLFCIEDGGVEPSRHLSTGVTGEVLTLRYLRNVIAHPARMPDDATENSADQFCFRMERDPEFWEFASELLGNWSLFGDHRVTRFALRRLNIAGRAYSRQLGLLPQR